MARYCRKLQYRQFCHDRSAGVSVDWPRSRPPATRTAPPRPAIRRTTRDGCCRGGSCSGLPRGGLEYPPGLGAGKKRVSLREPRLAAQHRRQSAQQRIACAACLEDLAENLDGADQVSGEGIRIARHDGLRTPGWHDGRDLPAIVGAIRESPSGMSVGSAGRPLTALTGSRRFALLTRGHGSGPPPRR